MSEKYDSTNDTNEHIWHVRDDIFQFSLNLDSRGYEHDKSKLVSPEKELFDEWTPKLKQVEYGSKEYYECLNGLKPGLDHHYANNSHHPQFWANRVKDMSLLDLLEMLADWHCATKRMANGSLEKSLKINTERFKLDEASLSKILANTAKEMGWL